MRSRGVEEERKGCLPRLLLTVVILALVALVTLFFAVRTDGGKAFIQGWLEKKLGMDLVVGKTRIGLPYVLVIEDVKSVGFKMDETAGLHAQEIRVAPGWRPMWSVTVLRGTCCLAQAENGVWEPSGLSFLGDLDIERPATTASATRELREKLRIRTEDGAIKWLAPGGSSVERLATGVFFSVTPLRAPDRRLYHYRLAVRSLRRPGFEATRDFQREWLATEEQDYVELSRSVPVGEGREQEAVISDQ